MNIIKLEIENVKRIRTASIEPDGSVVVVGGKNSAGKSSAIDSIAYALGGKALCPDEPLRRGKKRGSVRVDLGDYTVERVFTAKDSRLVICNADGFKASSPQALLDKIVGNLRLGFDPMAFVRKSRDEQLEVLKQLVGVDCDDLDRKRKCAYDERTVENRALKALAARVDGAPRHEDAPEEEVSVSDLLAELDRRREVNEQNEAQKGELEETARRGVALREDVSAINQQISALQCELEELQALQVKAVDEYTAQKKIVDALEDENLDEIRTQIDAAEKVNRRVRHNQARDVLAKELEGVKAGAAALTDKIEACDKEKAARLAAAEFPVEGLGFDESTVTLDGLPFDQAGQADQIRVAVAIALASGSDLKIALVRDGSLLDDDSLALLHRFADEAGGQIWLERVGAGPEVTVLIEDGAVAGAE